MKQKYTLAHATARQRAIDAVRAAPDGMVVEIRAKTRSLDQNARLWAMLTDLSRQLKWCDRDLSPADWKCLMTAHLKRHETVPGLDGGFVVLGAYTSQMTVRDMSDLIELMRAFGAENGVDWSDDE